MVTGGSHGNRSHMAATINDVAQHAGVSKKTVSRAINGGTGLSARTRDRVAASIAALGYRPDPQARALARQRTPFDAENARTAVANAVGWLVAHGHTRIAFLAGPEDDAPSRARELGYLDALADHGLDRGPSLIAGCDGSLASAHAAASLLLEVSPRPSAIVCATDLIAAAARQAAGALDIPVPERLSLIGCDDTPLAEALWPPLASLRIGYGLVQRASLGPFRHSV